MKTRRRNSELEAANVALNGHVQELSVSRDAPHRSVATRRTQNKTGVLVETKDVHTCREQSLFVDSDPAVPRQCQAPVVRAEAEFRETEQDDGAALESQAKNRGASRRGKLECSTKEGGNASDWEANRGIRVSGDVSAGGRAGAQPGLAVFHLAQCAVLGLVWGMMGMAWFYHYLLFGTESPSVRVCLDAALRGFSGSPSPCTRVASFLMFVRSHDARALLCRAGDLRSSAGDAVRSTSWGTASATAPPAAVDASSPGRSCRAAVYFQAVRSCGAGAPQPVNE